MEFTEYATRYSKDAVQCRKNLSPEIIVSLDGILDELADDPKKYPARVIPVSREGKNFVYMHPDPMIQITFEIDPENKILYIFHFSAPSLDVKQTVFISYSHKDKAWLDTIRKYLTVQEQEGLIKFWDDDQLKDGEQWKSQINEMLKSSKAGVLLVSQEFLSSKFINETELPRLLNAAEQDGKKLFWIPLSPSTVFDTHENITCYQSLLENPNTSLDELPAVEQQSVLVDISRKISQAMRAH